MHLHANVFATLASSADRFPIFLTLKSALPVCVVFWCPKQCARCTGGRRGADLWEVHSNRQRKESCWYFGGKRILDCAESRRLFLVEGQTAANLMILSTTAN